MRLGFGGPRSDGGPRDEIAQVLGGDGIQSLRGRGQAELVHLKQEGASLLHPFFDMEAVIHARIVDEALPAGRRARFLEIDPHDEHQRVGHFLRQRPEALGVVETSLGIVDGAGSHHEEQALVLAIQDALENPASLQHGVGSCFGERVPAVYFVRRGHRFEGFDVEVLSGLHG